MRRPNSPRAVAARLVCLVAVVTLWGCADVDSTALVVLPDLRPPGDSTRPPDAGGCGTNVCSQHGWCWALKHRQLTGFSAIWGNEPNDVYFTGRWGYLLRFTAGGWALDNTKIPGDHFGIWAFGPNDIFMVGEGDRPIAHYQGSVWKTWGPEQGTIQLRAVWGSGPADVYAVGDAGAVWRYDGKAWASQSTGVSRDLRGVWGSHEENVFAVGVGGTALQRDGQAWRRLSTGVTEDLHGIWGVGLDEVYAVGARGMVLKYDGLTWLRMDSTTTRTLLGVWGSGSTNVYAVGEAGTILHYDGAEWWPMSSKTTATLHSVWVAQDGSVFAAGDHGTILRKCAPL